MKKYLSLCFLVFFNLEGMGYISAAAKMFDWASIPPVRSNSSTWISRNTNPYECVSFFIPDRYESIVNGGVAVAAVSVAFYQLFYKERSLKSYKNFGIAALIGTAAIVHMVPDSKDATLLALGAAGAAFGLLGASALTFDIIKTFADR